MHRGRRLLAWMASARRWFSGDAEQTFMEAWKRVGPNIEPPKTPLSFIQPLPLSAPIPSKLTLNFYLPRSPLPPNSEVDMVVVPAVTGQMGILPGHMASMTELRPGLLSVLQGTETTKYFVSGGFVFVRPDSIADIIALEAVPIDRIDPSLVHKGLAEYSQKLTSATTDYERAEAQIGVDVYTALHCALTA